MATRKTLNQYDSARRKKVTTERDNVVTRAQKENKIKKQTEQRVKSAALGKPLNLSKEAWGSSRQNIGSGSIGKHDPMRFTQMKVKPEDMNDYDRMAQQYYSLKQSLNKKSKK